MMVGNTFISRQARTILFPNNYSPSEAFKESFHKTNPIVFEDMQLMLGIGQNFIVDHFKTY